MSLAEHLKDKAFYRTSVPVFFGALVLFVALVDASYLYKNLRVFFERERGGSDVIAPAVTPVITTPDTLTIPTLGISAPVIYITEKNEAAYQEALAKGVVHYPGTALPGEYGNVYIFGHSSDLPWAGGDYKTIFAPLPQITEGERIYLSNHEGVEFTYEVFETKIVTPNDLSVLDQFENKEQLLSLQTSYPLGTALRRFIVLARIVD